MGRNKKYVQDEGVQLCPECGEVIETEYGRRARKFCSDECRNKYHYRNLRASRNIRYRMTSKLEHNHEIFEGLIQLGITSVERTEAVQLGIDMEVMTSCHAARGHMDCTCYDISYRITDGRISNISKCLTTFAGEKSNENA